MRITEHAREHQSKYLPYFFTGFLPQDPTTKFYLLGSQHNLPAAMLPSFLDEILDSADVLVKEVGADIFGDAGDVPLKELRLHGLVADENSEDWTHNLSESARSYFHENIAHGITAAWNIKPHQISPVVVQHVVKDWRLGASQNVSMDQYIMRAFERRNKPVLALENGKTRFDADDTLFALSASHDASSLSEHAEMLDMTIRNNLIDAQNSSLMATSEPDFSAYFSANLDDLFVGVDARDLFKRNLSWMESMENLFTQNAGKTIVFMFGYAHLSGRYGIVQLLKNLGVRVERVSSHN